MFVRAYLRASTAEQDAARARSVLEEFAADHGKAIAAQYIENASGTRADRPELVRLLADSHPGMYCWWNLSTDCPACRLKTGRSSRPPSTEKGCESWL